MEKKMYKKMIYMIILFVGFISLTYGQDGDSQGYRTNIHNPVAVGVQGGFSKAADADNGKFLGGGLVRAYLTNAVAFEASILYRQEEYKDGAIKVSSWPVQLSGLFYPVEYLYGVVGVGWYNAKIEYSGTLNDIPDKTSQKFGWHFGAGLDIPLGERAFLFGDFRYVFLNYNFEDVPGGGEINSDYFQISAGLMFVVN
jgi:hypothetical protein